MANPVSYTWTPPSALNLIAPVVLLPAAGVALPLSINGYQSLNKPAYFMPQGTARQVTLTSTGGAVANTFVIVGLDEYGRPLTEGAITGPGAGLTVRSVNAYRAVFSITPTATAGVDIRASFADSGITFPFLSNVWAIDTQIGYQVNVTSAGGGLSIQPQYTLSQFPSYQPQGNIGAQPLYAPIWLNVPTQAGPTPPAIPIVATGNYGFVWPSDSPISAFRFAVTTTAPSELTAAFTATIMQQGGFF